MKFVIEWLNKLLITSPYAFNSAVLFTAIMNLEEEHYIPYVCDKKRINAYKMLLSLLFAQVKFVVESEPPVDDKLLQQSTELAFSLTKKAEMCCYQLG